MVAAAFGGAVVDGPAWRISAGETDREPHVADVGFVPSAEELVEADAIPFGEGA